MKEQLQLVPSGGQPTIAHCSRCHARCKVVGPCNADARLLRFSKVPDGYCGNCAVTEWLKTTEGIGELLENQRCRKCNRHKTHGPHGKACVCKSPDFPAIIEILSMPHFQMLFAQMMASGHSDLRPEAIDWYEVAANWDLPLDMPKRRKRKGSTA